MTLIQLSEEYRRSGELCKARLGEIRYSLEHDRMCEMDRMRLRRKADMLETMMRDTMSLSRYLENYYGGAANGRKEAEYVC